MPPSMPPLPMPPMVPPRAVPRLRRSHRRRPRVERRADVDHHRRRPEHGHEQPLHPARPHAPIVAPTVVKRNRSPIPPEETHPPLVDSRVEDDPELGPFVDAHRPSATKAAGQILLILFCLIEILRINGRIRTLTLYRAEGPRLVLNSSLDRFESLLELFRARRLIKS
jgi:hypothetical protein